MFVAATFAGLFIGTLVFGFVADRFGRRTIFTFSLLWYCVATVVMAFQNTGVGVVLWRLIAGIGIGVELVTIDTYIAELVPKNLRGRAFAVNQMIQFSVVPVVALLAWLLVPIDPFGFDGWRWVVLIGSVGAVVVWFIRLRLPESPRWLIQHGRIARGRGSHRADRGGGAARSGRRAVAAGGRDGGDHADQPGCRRVLRRDLARRRIRSRTIMLMVFQLFQTVGFYGFANWVPTLIAQQGINLSKSLLYSFVIAIANPFGPLLAFTIADKVERKWMLVTAAFCIGVFGMLFALQHEVPLLILFGVLITLANNDHVVLVPRLSDGVVPHAHPRPRGRLRLFLQPPQHGVRQFHDRLLPAAGGVPAVFAFIAFSMLMVMLAIGIFGPRTRNLQLERISH